VYCASKAALHTLSEVLAMECRPFNIDVMLVAPGTVTSNISKNQASTFRMPPDTLYAGYVKNIMERMGASQSMGAMPTAVFAKKVVVKALETPPPAYISIGGYAVVFFILKWLPRSWVLSLMWRQFSRK
jgi:1-acylglycerone phosphate reductase